MVTGDLGHHGTCVRSPVEEVSKLENGYAMTLNQNMVAKSVLVIPKTPKCATKKPAQLVRLVVS